MDNGKIVAVKGTGGTHLVAGTTGDDAILRMRRVLGRPMKPFAIMARDMVEAKRIAFISEKEEQLLSSMERPIVILSKKDKISTNISPGLGNIGIMLPYSGLHHLLFHYSNEPAFVMTSANIPGMAHAADLRPLAFAGRGFFADTQQDD
ncbi:MAG: Sua5/YciO/YrdC/YwlC family protein [Candidatus Methanoperedens sp.]|nr:Sua5/YciO/YrdC/YwlC family protein [Candidatus Methanoperedens sp.]